MNTVTIPESIHTPAISAEDIRVLRAIRKITKKGENAEVKQSKDGTLTVYAVKKSKEI